jgi:hypothetical protein
MQVLENEVIFIAIVANNVVQLLGLVGCSGLGPVWGHWNLIRIG